MTDPQPLTMKALRLNSYGEPLDVIRLEAIPNPEAGQVRVRVHACALNPADWALCRGFFPVPPRAVSGSTCPAPLTPLARASRTSLLAVSSLVFPIFMGQPTAGAAEYAILKVFVPVPAGLDLAEAAALPMAVETAVRSIDLLGLTGAKRSWSTVAEQ